MSNAYKLRRIFFGMTLGFGLLMGAPIRPEEIEELMAQPNRPKIVHVLRGEEDQIDEEEVVE
jgi:hypothetical protein